MCYDIAKLIDYVMNSEFFNISTTMKFPAPVQWGVRNFATVLCDVSGSVELEA